MQKKILVVEDFADTRVLVRFLLEGLGHQVLEATNGWQAVEVVKSQVPDLILMDMALPSINGLSATRLIRQFDGTAKVPIIAFTASGQFIQQQAMEAGCNDLVSKPLDIDKLESIINKYLAE